MKRKLLVQFFALIVIGIQLSCKESNDFKLSDSDMAKGMVQTPGGILNIQDSDA